MKFKVKSKDSVVVLIQKVKRLQILKVNQKLFHQQNQKRQRN
jgi:hypothetical protein